MADESDDAAQKQSKLSSLLAYVQTQVTNVATPPIGAVSLTRLAGDINSESTWLATLATEQASMTVEAVNAVMNSYDVLSEAIAGAMSPRGAYTASERAQPEEPPASQANLIKMNATKLEDAIGRVAALASRGSHSSLLIDNESEAQGDPVDISAELTSIRTCCYALEGRAGDIRRCKRAIIELNENGVCFTDNAGNIVYPVPEGVEAVDSQYLATAAYNTDQALKDADALSYARKHGGKDQSGRTVDEILDAMYPYQDDPNYATAYAKKYGVAQMLDDPIRGPQSDSPKYVERYGHMIAAASLSYDHQDPGVSSGSSGSSQYSLADEISTALEEKGHDGRATSLAAMMNNDSLDELYLSRAKEGKDLYSSAFLVDLANRAESNTDWSEPAELPADSKRLGLKVWQFKDGSSGYQPDRYSADPLAAVLGGMEYSPRASIDYFSQSNGSRVDALSKRNWRGQGLANFTGALAAGSALRSSTDPGMAARADAVTGRAISALAANTDPSDYDSESKGSLGQMLGNCSAEVTSAWTGDDPWNPYTGSKGLMNAGATKDDIDKLAYRIADDEDAVATLSSKLGDHTRATSHTQAASATSPDSSVKETQSIYYKGARAAGYFAGIADKRANVDSANDSATHSKNAAAVYSAYSTAGATALGLASGPVAPVVTAGVNVTAALLQPVLLSNIGAPATSDDSNAASRNTLFAAGVQDLSSIGAISQDTLAMYPDKPWIKHDAEGKYYVDVEGLNAEQMHDVYSWTQQIQMAPGFNENMDEMNRSVNGGWTDGKVNGASIKPG